MSNLKIGFLGAGTMFGALIVSAAGGRYSEQSMAQRSTSEARQSPSRREPQEGQMGGEQ